jgi:CRISPR-associated protein Cas2
MLMPSLMVLAVTAVPPSVRGAISRWLIEAAPGLYVGSVSARVRDELWVAIEDVIGDGAAVCAFPDDSEQGYRLRTAGDRRRETVDFDGLTLVKFRAPSHSPAQALAGDEGSPDTDFNTYPPR